MCLLHQDIIFQEIAHRWYSACHPQSARVGAPRSQSDACQEGALSGADPTRSAENSQMYCIQVPRAVYRIQAEDEAHRIPHFGSSTQRIECTRSDRHDLWSRKTEVQARFATWIRWFVFQSNSSRSICDQRADQTTSDRLSSRYPIHQSVPGDVRRL